MDAPAVVCVVSPYPHRKAFVAVKAPVKAQNNICLCRRAQYSQYDFFMVQKQTKWLINVKRKVQFWLSVDNAGCHFELRTTAVCRGFSDFPT